MSPRKKKPRVGDEISWLRPLSPGGGPRYQQIVDLLGEAIANEVLRPGDRLPPQRQLAEALGVDLTTVTRAYDEARKRRLLEAHGQRGTFVKGAESELTQWVDLSLNVPPIPSQIDLSALFSQGLAVVTRHSEANLLFTYHLGGGRHADRQAAARWLAPALGPVAPARVVVCPGAQAALAAIVLNLTEHGDAVLTEPLVYPGLRTTVQQLGRRVVSVAIDDAGMRPDALEEACREHKARLIYLNPTLQNPTAHTMPAARRQEIAKVAARVGVKIIEDDPYWLFAHHAPAPICAIAPDLVYYVSTLSKCLSPGLRTAFVVLPDPSVEDRFLAAVRTFALMPMPLATALVTQWIQDGSAQTLLSAVQTEARARQQLAAQNFAQSGQAAVAEGIHLWRSLPPHWSARELARAAREGSLSVTPSDAFFVGTGEPPRAIRISLGGGRDRLQLVAALRNLSALLATPPSERTEVVI
ncbi:DNA-binding transcriptional MocR family regulator [Paraburkholderia atlantica]|uniref:aminotransferase-like domain-containing protein n=1 Tax=Paraburkholderia atlantica TaxID=2654982 RepID=UPI003D1E2AD8